MNDTKADAPFQLGEYALVVRSTRSGSLVSDMVKLTTLCGGGMIEADDGMEYSELPGVTLRRCRLERPTPEQIAEYMPLREERIRQREDREATARRHADLRKTPEFQIAGQLQNAIGSRSPEELLEYYSPAAIVAAWKALNGEG